MRIAYFSDTFLPNINGVVTSICNSAKMLATRGHKIMIFTRRPKDSSAPELGRDIDMVYFPRMGVELYPDFDFAIPRVFKMFFALCRFRPEIIHIHTPGPLGVIAIIFGKILRIPIVNTYHTTLPDILVHIPIPNIEKNRVAKHATWTYTRRYYGRSSAVIAPSESTKKELEGQRLRNIVVISNGVDVGEFKHSPIPHKEFHVLHVGRISYEKSIDVVLNAFKLFSEKHKAKLKIVGFGPELGVLKKLAADLKIDAEFTGKISAEELLKAYNSADVFITASTMETEGLVVLEAMACGVPVVGVNARAVPRIVKPGENGFIAEPGDAQGLADCMSKVFTHGKAKFSADARRTAEEHSLDKSIDKIEKLYSDLAARRKLSI